MNTSRLRITMAFGAALALALAGCSSSPASQASLPAPPTATSAPPAASSSSPAAHHHHHHRHRHHHRRVQVTAAGLVQVHDPGQVTGTLTGTCHARDGGQLPDRRCTPGAYDPAVTTAVLCSAGYSTSSYRAPESQTETFKFSEAYPAYGVAGGTTSELDHLIPLELGGANDAANLWPEVGSLPNPKDHVENALHDAVCSGQVALRAAQRAIAIDWETALQRLGIGEAAPAPAPTHSTQAAAGGCHPHTPSGGCYTRGEFCSEAEHGEHGVAGDGETITCTQDGSYWRWL
jgi:hypothetical protein